MTKDAFESLVVMQLAGSASAEWMLDRVRGSKGLLACCPVEHQQQRAVRTVYIGASTERLLRGAEVLQLKKKRADDTQQQFTVDTLNSFQGADNKHSFLTVSEKQRIILHELESMRARETEELLDMQGNSFTLVAEQAIVDRLRRHGTIISLFPLHNEIELNQLTSCWYLTLQPTSQPLGIYLFGLVASIDQVRQYFGETVAMYFAFIACYTNHLVPTALMGLLCTCLSSEMLIPLFCLLNMVWSTVFLERWKRRCCTLAHRWGTLGSTDVQELKPRAVYHGERVLNRVTKREELRYPKTWHWLKFCCVSVPVMLVSLLVSVLVALAYFWLCSYIEPMEKGYELSTITFFLIHQSPNVLYAIIILLMNAVYTRIAFQLNDWENHRLQSSYENHLITKLVLFTFTNCFTPLFYVAFYLQDLQLLRSHLGILMVTHMVVQQLFEAVWPYITYKWRKVTVAARQHIIEQRDGGCGVSDKVRRQAEKESTKEEYARLLNDYLELFVQFGYVFLFSSVFPIAALLALINNLVEIRTDAFKLCWVYRRPFSQPTDGIGVWQVAFEMLSVIAVMTNCALFALTPSVHQHTSSYESVSVFLVFVSIEQFILFIKAALSYLIPDIPENVRMRIALEKSQSRTGDKLE